MTQPIPRTTRSQCLKIDRNNDNENPYLTFVPFVLH
ncbi:BgTH12-03621 [Blumeria graminis f. sp. triticale]|uniref:BgTH12-03621 n=1 Tax=Blumeria graminis f. sp. triticale TaxID=1689686 RepID=A0A9W4GBG6_BLUGR|nr:BgTH12-03621 [Blumeria graminis f. sp. triticale]